MLTPTLLIIASAVIILLFAGIVRLLGTKRGYQTIFVLIALSLGLKTYFGW